VKKWTSVKKVAWIRPCISTVNLPDAVTEAELHRCTWSGDLLQRAELAAAAVAYDIRAEGSVAA